MIDLDDFKGINDGLGHPAGDRLLHAVSDGLRVLAKGRGRAYRYGGDEFAAILLDASSIEANSVADEIKAAVGRIPMPSGYSPSATIGVAMRW